MAGMRWYRLDNVYLQQDGSGLRATQATKPSIFYEKVSGRVISPMGDHNWPSGSCELTPCGFFFWGYVKDGIRQAIEGISSHFPIC